MTVSLVANILSSRSTSLSEHEVACVNKMLWQLGQVQTRAKLRQKYYDQKALLKDLNISVPPQLKTMESVLGWPAKTVDVLADRVRFEKFTAPDEGDNPFGLDQIVDANFFVSEFRQAMTSALTHSCAFITVSRGDVRAGEPDILWLPRSALTATGLWNQRSRSLDAGLTITGNDGEGRITEMCIYLPGKFAQISVKTDGRMVADVRQNNTGRVMMEPLRTAPDLRRPFGRSRISRAVMSLTDSAIRTIVRSEIGAEFFASPQRYILGADADVIKDKWSALVSRMPAIGKDEDGDVPTIGQFPQISMQPHTDQLRQWAALLAAESSIPLDELGFPSDNPSSDAAIQSQREPLRAHAERIIDDYRPTLKRLAVSSLMLRDGVSDASTYSGLQSVFAPTVRVTDAAAADAVLKKVQAMPWLADSNVILERLGFDADEIRRLEADRRRAQGGALIDRVLNTASPVPDGSETVDVSPPLNR